MKKRLIIIITCAALLLFLFLFLLLKNNNKTMECNIKTNMVDSEAELKYVFKGKNDIAKEQFLYAKLYITDENLINEYQNIISGNLECGGIDIFDNYISYNCYYDLVNEHYYEDLEDEDGDLSFIKLKEAFENDNYICEYK